MVKKWLLLFAVVSVAFAGVMVYSRFFAEPTVIQTEALIPFDPTNANELVGWSDFVAVGYVKENLGEQLVRGKPTTQFAVEVIETIKGPREKDQIVTQYAGHTTKGWKRVFLIDARDTLLEVEQVYLLSGMLNHDGTIHLHAGMGNEAFADVHEMKQQVALLKKTLQNN